MVRASHLRHHGHSTIGENGEAGFFERLPDKFSPRDARGTLGKSHEAANILIRKMMDLGIVPKTAHR
jgi:hypothetical protein